MLPKKVIFSFIVFFFSILTIGVTVFPQQKSNIIKADTCNYPGLPTITDPINCPVKSGSTTFSINDPTPPFPHTVKMELSVSGRPFCKNLWPVLLSKTGVVFTSPSWNTTSVSDGTYWLNVTIYYGTGASSVNNALFTINNGLTGTACDSPNPASVDIKANDQQGPISIDSGTSATISWTSVNVTNCIIYNNSTQVGSGKSGSISSGPLTSAQTYYSNCAGLLGPATDSVKVNINSSSGGGSSGGTSSGGSSGSSDSSSSGSTSKSSTQTTTTTNTAEIVTPTTLASSDKLVIEEIIPVSVSEFDPDIFLRGDNIQLTEIKNVKKGNTNVIHFQGKTKPKTLVTLYIFSNPVIVTLKSDSKGDWSYDRDKKLDTGDHTAFATIYDEGVTRRSDTTKFFLAKNTVGNLVLSRTTSQTLYFYGLILGGILLLSILILITYRLYTGRKNS